MAKPRNMDTPQRRLEKTNAVLDAIETAIEFEDDFDATAELPSGLRDPVRVMERVRELFSNGVMLPEEAEADFGGDLADDDEAYRAAARNGKPISEEVLARMHREREEAERGDTEER